MCFLYLLSGSDTSSAAAATATTAAPVVGKLHCNYFSGNVKGGFKLENDEGFLNLPKNIPKNYLKFVHPIHDIGGIFLR